MYQIFANLNRLKGTKYVPKDPERSGPGMELGRNIVDSTHLHLRLVSLPALTFIPIFVPHTSSSSTQQFALHSFHISPNTYQRVLVFS